MSERIADIFVWIDRAKPDADAKASEFILVDKVIDTLDEDDMPSFSSPSNHTIC